MPTFVLGGAQKSGTTSLHRVLQSHPEIFIPRPPVDQEIHYFDLDGNHAKGVAWYESHFTAWNGEPVIGQTSPLYLYAEKAPERMHALLPDAKLVFILRDPVQRAYSHYWHEVRFGREVLSFENAIEREPERLRKGDVARRHYSYVDRGFYARQLERWREFFDRDQILIVLSETFQVAPDAVLRALAKFLGVNDGNFDTMLAWQRHNSAKIPRISLVQRLIRPIREHLPRIGHAVDLLNLQDRPYPPMNPSTRESLKAAFAEDITALEKRWSLDLRPWASRPESGR